jgi:hypothetical protein
MLLQTEGMARIHRDDLVGTVAEEESAIHRRHPRFVEWLIPSVQITQAHNTLHRPLSLRGS